MKLLHATLLALSLLCPLLPSTAIAGLDEGIAAYKRSDDATAFREFKTLADQGNSEAQIRLGDLYRLGRGVVRADSKEAMKWFQRAADQGNAKAQNAVGWMYETGEVGQVNYEEALKWYRLAADQGNSVAQTNLGLTYEYGRGVPTDRKEAIKWYRLAYAQGNAKAKSSLYRVAPRMALAGFEELPDGFEQGMTAFEKADYPTALREFKTLAAQGYAKAQYALGDMYQQAIGVRRDYKEAIKWHRLAAQQGNADSQVSLGSLFRPDSWYLEKYPSAKSRNAENADTELNSWYRLAAQSYRKAADRGDAHAQYWIGRMLAYGHGVKQDSVESEKWFRAAVASYRLAAEQGYAPAQAMLGEMYFMGQGVQQDHYNEPIKWYRLAAEQGHAEAQYQLAEKIDVGVHDTMKRDGTGPTGLDINEVMKWHRIAADHGYGPSRFHFAHRYKIGLGVPQDKVLAYALFSIDYSNFEDAENLAKSMTNQEIKAAKAMAIELSKPGNFLIALDQYSKKPAIKEKVQAKPVAANDDADDAPTSVASSDTYPARPAKRPGVVSCNTRCINAACWRTYDSGKKVRFQAQHKYDALSGEWKFDSGPC